MAKQKNLYRDHHFNQIKTGWNVVFSIILCLISLLMLIPLVLIVVVSFSSEASIALNGFSFFPTEWTLVGYKYLAKMGDQILVSYRITIIITILGTLMSLFVMTMYAYVLAQKNFVFRKFFMWILFFTMLFSGGLVASYVVNSNILGLRNTIWVLILPLMVSSYNIVICKTFFKTSIPDSIIESAKIDGATQMRTFLSIVIPISKPLFATIALFLSFGYWNDWFLSSLYISDSKLISLQALLNNIMRSLEYMANNPSAGVSLQQYKAQMPGESVRMAIAIVIVIPIACAYPFFQKYFISGLTIGAVKG